MGLTEEEKRKRNARYQREHRQRVKARKQALREQVNRALLERKVREATRGLAPWHEYLRAGYLAGLLEASFRHCLEISDAQGARRWLRDHPIGASYVLELLSVAGLAADFLRWRG